MLAHKYNKAFSLVELMVVIAIIGILSAIAVPSYKSYIIKSRITSMIPTLESGINIAMQYYDINGTFPNPLTVYGNSMPMISVASVNIPPATYAWYGGALGSLGSSVQLCLLFSDIGIPGFIAPAGNSGKYDKICMVAVMQNNIWSKYCGNWGVNETMNIPVQYLPTGCNCACLANVTNGGACTDACSN